LDWTLPTLKLLVFGFGDFIVGSYILFSLCFRHKKRLK